MLSKLLITSSIFILSLVSKEYTETTSTVYVCMGKSSKRYHYSSSCRGLSNCSTNLSNIDINQAKNMGRTLCGWED